MPQSNRAFHPCAARYANGGRRLHAEDNDPLRNPFEVDRHRIIASTAFRRLKYKTQGFAAEHHDHFRTRLTHTLEVANVARTLARNLRVDADLAEAIALAHDLGHPPFGHAGEEALNEAMADVGGFNHNAHSLRVVEYLEHPYPAFRGLNLTVATLAGLRAHATPFDTPDTTGEVIVEGEVASVADRIAYNLHDLEDAIGAGLLDADQLAGLELWCRAYDRWAGASDALPLHAIRRSVLDTMLDQALTDVIDTAQAQRPVPSSDAPVAARLIVAFSSGFEQAVRELESFLVGRVYRQESLARMDEFGRRTVGELFQAYRNDPNRLPARFRDRMAEQGPIRVIGDYIAGMTDRFCVSQFRRWVDANDAH